jgi:hypothetical protein
MSGPIDDLMMARSLAAIAIPCLALTAAVIALAALHLMRRHWRRRR